MKKLTLLLATTCLLLTLALPSVTGAKTPDPDECGPGSIKSGKCADMSHDVYIVTVCKSGAAVCHATQHDDEIHGSRGPDDIRALDGWDIVLTREGEDTVYGASGRDRIEDMTCADVLFGWTRRDHIYGGSGADNLFGGPGDDVIFGGVGSDQVDCGGADRVFVTEPDTFAANCEKVVKNN
jgi:Ca2+-binding RTX toxin-like protein